MFEFSSEQKDYWLDQALVLVERERERIYQTTSAELKAVMQKLVIRVLWDNAAHDRYGEYYGVPYNKQTQHDSFMPPPEIVIFVEPIVQHYSNLKDFQAKVNKVFLHELGHHLGLGEGDLRARKLS